MLERKQNEITDAGFETVKSTIELAKNAKLLWKSRSAEERIEMLKMVLSNPVLDGPSLRYDLKKPFAVLAEMSQKSDWREQLEQLRTDLLSFPLPPWERICKDLNIKFSPDQAVA